MDRSVSFEPLAQMAGDSEAPLKLRLDKWLWQARFFKTRSLATRQVSAGAVRVNANRVNKPAHMIAPDDVLTFAQARRVRVIQVVALGERRGPASEAQALYTDLTPAETVAEPQERVGVRPTKRDRRAFDALRDR